MSSSDGSTMLTDEDVERYARQIVVPGIGVSGQARICASSVYVIGEAAGAAYAETYARAAGFRTEIDADARLACVLVAGTRRLDSGLLAAAAERGCPVLFYEVTQSGVRCGRLAAGTALEPRADVAGCDEDEGFHALGAADLVASAIAVVLDWSDVESTYEIDLA